MNQEQPWLTEPDFNKWIDPETGYHCVIRRTPELLHLCGYVRVPRSHPLCGKYTDNRKTWRIQVHGGLTFSGRLSRPSGAPIRGFWFGFDCGHYMDLVPGLQALSLALKLSEIRSGAIYRELPYVKGQVTFLAKQLKAMKK